MTKKQTRRRRQGNLKSRCAKCGAEVEFSSWMTLNAFLNAGRVCDGCAATRALAEDTFARIERSIEAQEQFARKF